MNNLCTCLTEKNVNHCFEEIKKIKTDLIEHRIDYLEKTEGFERIYDKFENKDFIATCRNKSNGGKFEGNEKERIKILLKAIENKVKMVDIELGTKEIDLVIEKAKEKQCLVIVSMHDFEKTPSLQELIEIMEKEKKTGSDIGKIVCRANNFEDCHNLLEVILRAKKINFPLIAFGMGEIGKFSRVVSLLYGSPFTFVSNNIASAPGQMNYEEIKKIIKILKYDK